MIPAIGVADGERDGIGESEGHGEAMSVVGGILGLLGTSSLIGAGEGCEDGHRIGRPPSLVTGILTGIGGFGRETRSLKSKTLFLAGVLLKTLSNPNTVVSFSAEVSK